MVDVSRTLQGHTSPDLNKYNGFSADSGRDEHGRVHAINLTAPCALCWGGAQFSQARKKSAPDTASVAILQTTAALGSTTSGSTTSGRQKNRRKEDPTMPFNTTQPKSSQPKSNSINQTVFNKLTNFIPKHVRPDKQTSY